MNAPTNIFDMFETDAALEKDGVTIEYGVNSKGEAMQVTVARAGGANAAYAKAYERITKPYRRQLDAGMRLPKELNDRLYRELYAEAVIRSMSGFEERDGTPIDTSTREGVIKMLERLPNLFADIQSTANTMTLFRDEQQEGTAGN